MFRCIWKWFKKTTFNSPLIIIDKKTKKYKLKIFPDITKDENENTKNEEETKTLSKECDIVYLKDTTGSMEAEIKAANDYVINIISSYFSLSDGLNVDS